METTTKPTPTQYRLPDVDGIEHRIPAEAVDELVREAGLGRPKMRTLVRIKRAAATATRGERWRVTFGWAAATKGGLPDEVETTRAVSDLVSSEFRLVWSRIGAAAADEAGLREDLEVALDELVFHSTPEFKLTVRDPNEAGPRIQGKAKMSFALNASSELRERILDLGVRGLKLADGKERAQTELKLEGSGAQGSGAVN